MVQRKDKIAKLKTPVFCVACNKSFKPHEPCKHMIADGFQLGIDGGDFYADSWKAKARRKQLQQLRKNVKKKKATLDGFT